MDTTSTFKLIKYLVLASGVSRRECQRYLVDDRVSVNGKINHQPSFMVDQEKDKVTLDGNLLQIKKTEFSYVMLHKPKGVICTHDDAYGRKTIYTLLHHKNLSNAGLFSAGRLDFNTTGLIILTNDGEFSNLLTHPRYDVKKEYIVHIKRTLDQNLIRRMLKGVKTDTETLKFDKVFILSEGTKGAVIKVVLNEGKNREIRKMMQFFKVTIRSIHRIKMGPFILDKLKEGQYELIKKIDVEAFKRSFSKGAGTSNA